MLTKEQRKMVEDNHNLIFGFCRTYNLDKEEVYDLLAIALCKSAMCYDPGKGYSFSTYVFQVFRRTLNRNKERLSRQKRVPENQLISLSEKVKCFEEDESGILERYIPDTPVDFDKRLFLRDFYSWAEKHLTNKEVQTLRHIAAGFTLQQIGAMENITHQAIKYRLKRVGEKIKRADGREVRDLLDGLRN